MMGRMALLQEFSGPSLDPFPGIAGLEARESLIPQTFSARGLLPTQMATEQGESVNAFLLRGPENPTDGTTESRSDLTPLLNLVTARRFFAP